MAKISKIINEKFTYSFEFFPPKDEKGDEQLWQTITDFKNFSPNFSPDFVSVTFGAGGSTRERTREISEKLKSTYGIEVVEHFTCYGFSIKEIESYIESAKGKNMDNILALRGDKPKNNPDFKPAEGSLKNAAELVEFMSKRSDFCIGVAGYPEKHPDAVTLEADIDFLKKKVDAGADFIITQLFFDNDNFFDFMDKIRARRINVPVIAGILPITSYNNLERFVELSSIAVPAGLKKVVESHKNDNDYIVKYGIEYALNQIKALEESSTNSGIHLYCLNKSYSCIEILKRIGF